MVVGPPEDQYGFARWLGRAGLFKAEDFNETSLVIFAGGADVNPRRYGEAPIPETHYDDIRDSIDDEIFEECELRGIPMLGICRGSQYLWTKLGGRLYQDVDCHNDGDHEITYLPTRQKYLASSVHHQMVAPRSWDGFKLLATAVESQNRKSATHTSKGMSSDFEIWTDTKKVIVGIQGHPEYHGYPQYSKLCMDIIHEFIYDSPKTQFINGVLRVTN